MRMMYSTAFVAIICVGFSVLAQAQSNSPQTFSAKASPHRYVMDSLNPYAPYEVKKRRYKALKDLGVEAITMDMWWGITEPEEEKSNWAIYKENFQLLKEIGLKGIPILSNHSESDFPLPKWVWNKGKDMKFKDSYGVENEEFLSYFVTEGHTLRKKRLLSFKENFHQFDSIIPKIYIGLGPAGEARYPSFTSHWNYPGVGRHQAGSDSARVSFQNFAREKYGIVEKLNGAWGTSLESFESLSTPTDGLSFFKDGINTEYGKDFMEWYQGVLEASVNQDQKDANEILKTGENSFHGALAGKIAGLYWLATDKVFSHGAERAAGYYNYDHLIKVFEKNNFELTFTCFEMENKDYYPDFSRAADLVAEVAQLAKKNNVKLSGENAEPFDLSYRSWGAIDWAYRNITKVFEQNDISAFTFLRADFLVNPDGSLRPEAALYRQHMAPPVLTKTEEELASNRIGIEGCVRELSGLGRPSQPLQPLIP
jgi:alpha-amylase